MMWWQRSNSEEELSVVTNPFTTITMFILETSETPAAVVTQHSPLRSTQKSLCVITMATPEFAFPPCSPLPTHFHLIFLGKNL